MYKPLRLWLRGSTFLLRRSDQSTAFAGVRLFSAWSLRPPELCSCDLRSNAPPDRLCRRSFSAFPSPPDRLCRRSTSDGVGGVAMNRPTASRLWQGRFGRLCLPPLLGWCSVSAPLRPCQKRKLQKALPFTIFFPTKTPPIQQFILILRCE